jgi:protocatechuate 3,4-dioxygenase beta subunit
LAGEAGSALAATGEISGQISNGTTGVPGEVEIYSFEVPLKRVSTAPDGTYTASELAEGSVYEVGFFPQGKYLPQYYNGSTTLLGASPVSVKAGQTTSGISAVVEPESRISGTVTDSSKAKLQDVNVYAYTPSGEFVGFDFTAEDGSYTIVGLPAGKYALKFVRFANGGEQSIYYKGQSSLASANPITLAKGESASGIDEVLPALGQVSGTVRDSEGHGLQGVDVELLLGESKVGSALSSAGGGYLIERVLPGPYKVRFTPAERTDYLPQYFNGVASATQATTVNVASGATSGAVDATLATAAEVAGTVTDTLDASIEGVQVALYTAQGTFPLAYTHTDSQGRYSFPGLESGAYRLEYSKSAHQTAYYAGKTTLAAAVQVSASAGAVTSGIDARLPPAPSVTGAREGTGSGAITGVVTGPGGTRIEGAIVAVSDSQGHRLGQATTGAGGAYTFNALSAGEYPVEFESGPGQNFAPQPHSGAVSVGEGAVTFDVDAQMHTGGTIAGTVRGGSGQALANIEVTVYHAGALTPEVVGATVTAPDGTYSVAALADGAYLVRFANAFEPAASLVTQFYSGRASLATADPVSVTEGSTASGIDATLAAGGTVSGRLTDAAGKPVGGTRVEVLGSEGGYVSGAITGANGSWSVGDLAAGSYIVRFVPAATQNLLSRYYPQAEAPSGAQTVAVSAERETTGIDAQLPPASEISGTDGLGYSYVTILEPDGAHVLTVQTNGSGEYDAVGLLAGSYDVRFEPLSYQEYLPQYYNAASTLKTATPVSTEPAKPATGIDATLEQGAKIEGTVTGESGVGVGGVEVIAYDEGGQVAARSVTVPSGSYTLVGLPAGSYRVGFLPRAGAGYAVAYYAGKTALEEATQVALASRHTVTKIDARLTPGSPTPSGGSIEGAVTDQRGAGLAGVEVIVLGRSGVALAEGVTAADGNYAIGGLASGSYDVEFQPTGANDLTEFYPNALTLSEAQPVVVAAGAPTLGIDAKIETVGSPFSGRVSGESPLEASTGASGSSTPSVSSSPSAVGGGLGNVAARYTGAKRALYGAGVLKLALGCPGPSACAGSVAVVVHLDRRGRPHATPQKSGRELTLAAGSYSLGPGGSVTLALRLSSRAGRLLLAHHAVLPATLAVSAAEMAGVRSFALTLAPAPAHAKRGKRKGK